MKLLTQTIVLAMVLIFTASAFAQTPTPLSPTPTSPSSPTRQRKATTDEAPQTTPEVKPNVDPAPTREAAFDKAKSKTADPAAAITTSSGPFTEPTPTTVTTVPAQKGDKTKSKEAKKPLSEVTADGQTNRRDQDAEAEAIVPYYNNFFTTYRLGPEDVISVTVFGQDRYSKGNIKIPPSGRISLALISDGILVNGKTVDQVAELVKKRYDEFIIEPQVSVSRDQAGSYRYSVIGDVAQPGIKLMSRRLSVTEAISEAGGVLQTGNPSKIFVLRPQAKRVVTPNPANVFAVDRGPGPDSVYLLARRPIA